MNNFSTQDYESEINAVKKLIISYHEENNDLISEKDIEKYVQNDAIVKRFLVRRGYRVDETVELILGFLRWRASRGLDKFTLNSIPKEIHEWGAIFLYEEDVNGNIVLYLRNKFWAQMDDDAKQLIENYMIHLMLEAALYSAKKGPEYGWVLIFDLSETKLINYDFKELYWIIEILIKYFPKAIRTIIVYNLPWILKSMSRTVMAFVPSDYHKVIRFDDAKSIRKIIPQQNLPKFMKGTCNRSYTSPPLGATSIKDPEHIKYVNSYNKIIESLKLDVN